MCGSELVALPEGVQKVAAWLEARGHPHAPVMLDGAARTAQQAADSLGVELGQIAKSIVFRRKSDDVAVLVVTSGDRRVDERKLEDLVCPDGKRIGRADAAFVKTKTGFSIGGVTPLAHAGDVLTLIAIDNAICLGRIYCIVGSVGKRLYRQLLDWKARAGLHQLCTPIPFLAGHSDNITVPTFQIIKQRSRIRQLNR